MTLIVIKVFINKCAIYCLREKESLSFNLKSNLISFSTFLSDFQNIFHQYCDRSHLSQIYSELKLSGLEPPGTHCFWFRPRTHVFDFDLEPGTHRNPPWPDLTGTMSSWIPHVPLHGLTKIWNPYCASMARFFRWSKSENWIRLKFQEKYFN